MHAHSFPSPGLPAPLTAFIGREREVADLLELVSGNRLVTVTGAGGTGKTRLALEIARKARRTADATEVRWVELAPLGGGELLIQHITSQLQVRERPDCSPLDSLLEALQPPTRLIVLDNCEHVIEQLAGLVAALLRRCENVHVLATSREALGLDGERVWLLRGLALNLTSEPSVRAECEAVRLFVDRAQSVARDFRLTSTNLPAVLQICNRLDGLPLAIELAAARTGALAVEQVAARLDDAFGLLTRGNRAALPRHRTLRAAVDWSYQLVSPDEQDLLQRLSVFAGTFSIEAAERVCSDPMLCADKVLDLLAGLVTRSLVTMHEESDGARYSLLEIIRQYARELLAGNPERLRALNLRHAAYFAGFAVDALPHLERSHSTEAAARVTLEYDNLRAALRWSFGQGDRELAHRLAGALWRYWGQTWQLSEADHWWREALAGPDQPDSQEWGQVLNGAGTFMYVTGDLERGHELLSRAAEVLGRTGDRTHQAMALTTLAHISCGQKKLDAALELASRAAEIARKLPEAWPLCNAMSHGLSLVYKGLGRHDLAEACLDEALAKAQLTGTDPWGVATVARASAELALELGRVDEAKERTLAAMDAVQTLLDPHLAVRVLMLVEKLLVALGHPVAAAQAGGAIAAAREGGMLLLLEDLAHHDELHSVLRRSLGDADHSRELASGATRTVTEAITLAALQIRSTQPKARAPVPAVMTPMGHAAPDLSVRVLGNTEVYAAPSVRVLDAPGHLKCLELLAYLLTHPGGLTRDQIGLAFWPDASSMQVKNNFHVLLHRLRRALGRSDYIIASGQRYMMNPGLDVWFDSAIFERETSAALRRAESDQESRQLESALALYKGPFLGDLQCGDWAIEERNRLQLLYCAGLSAMADSQIRQDEIEAAILTLEKLTQTDDLREDSWRRLMTCLARNGRRDLALRHYQDLTRRLREQLGVAPEPATRALAGRLSNAGQP